MLVTSKYSPLPSMSLLPLNIRTQKGNYTHFEMNEILFLTIQEQKTCDKVELGDPLDESCIKKLNQSWNNDFINLWIWEESKHVFVSLLSSTKIPNFELSKKLSKTFLITLLETFCMPYYKTHHWKTNVSWNRSLSCSLIPNCWKWQLPFFLRVKKLSCNWLFVVLIVFKHRLYEMCLILGLWHPSKRACLVP